MLRMVFQFLTNPLGLPIEPQWEYVILLLAGEIGHEIGWYVSPGGRAGSLIYWVTKLIAFVVIWAVLYAIIAVIQFIVAYWIWFTISAAVLMIAGIMIVIWRRKRYSSTGNNDDAASQENGKLVK